jgi:hypothetical protein
MRGEEVFNPVSSSKIMTELARLPGVGIKTPDRKWNNIVEYGDGFGAIQVAVAPLGSMRIMTRRKTSDLQGNPVWILKNVFPLCDKKDLNLEETIASNIHQKLFEIENKMVEGPASEYPEFKKLAEKLWNSAKRNHPSYIMFPVTMRLQSENLYKFIFEFRGQGIGAPTQNRTGRAERFDIDLYWDREKGLIRCWAYDIESNINQHNWSVQVSEWDENFSPKQPINEIVEAIIVNFLQY